MLTKHQAESIQTETEIENANEGKYVVSSDRNLKRKVSMQVML